MADAATAPALMMLRRVRLTFTLKSRVSLLTQKSPFIGADDGARPPPARHGKHTMELTISFARSLCVSITASGYRRAPLGHPQAAAEADIFPRSKASTSSGVPENGPALLR
jgi:hypothetical protein